MALGLNATADYLSRASGWVDYDASRTVFFRFRLRAQNAACTGLYTITRNIAPGVNAYDVADWIGFSASGTELHVGCFAATSQESDTSDTLSNNTWYSVALVRESTTALKLYLNGTLTHTLTTNVSARNDALYEVLGPIFAGTDITDCILEDYKEWSAALNATEVATEHTYLTAVRTANLNTYCSFATDGSASTGTGFTLNGTVTTETGSGAPLPGLTLTLTGTAVTASAGTLTQSRSLSLTGQASTSAAGALSLGVSKTLTGEVVQGQAGSIQYTSSGSITLTLTGQAVTASAGTFTQARSKALTGASVAAAAGTLTPTWQATYGWTDITGEDGYRVKWGTASNTYTSSADVAADVTSYLIAGLAWGTKYYARVYGLVGGVEQDPSTERELTQNDVTATLTGTAVTASAGTLTQSRSKSLTGTAVTAASGSISPNRGIALSGQDVQAQAGTISYSSDHGTTVTLLGESVVGTAGTLTTERAVAVAGSQAAFATGTVSYSSATDVTVSLTGSQAAFSAGTVSYVSSSIVLSLSGSQMATAVGVFSPAHSNVLSGYQIAGQAGTINGTFTQPPLLRHRRTRRGSKAWLDGLISGVFPFRK